MAYILEYTRNGKLQRMELPDNLTVDTLRLSGVENVTLPAGLKCEFLDLTGSKNVKLPANLTVTGDLHLDGTDGIEVPAGFKCQKLDLREAKNVKIPMDAEIGEIVGEPKDSPSVEAYKKKKAFEAGSKKLSQDAKGEQTKNMPIKPPFGGGKGDR